MNPNVNPTVNGNQLENKLHYLIVTRLDANGGIVSSMSKINTISVQMWHSAKYVTDVTQPLKNSTMTDSALFEQAQKFIQLIQPCD